MLLSRSEAVESGSREASGPGVEMVDSTFVEKYGTHIIYINGLGPSPVFEAKAPSNYSTSNSESQGLKRNN